MTGPYPHLMRRLLAVCGLVVVMTIVMSLIVPSFSHADRGPDASPTVVASGDPGILLGQVVGPDVRIQIFAGDPEPTFTVLALDGRILAEALSYEELNASYPDVSIDSRFSDTGDHAAGPGEPVMTADTNDFVDIASIRR